MGRDGTAIDGATALPVMHGDPGNEIGGESSRRFGIGPCA